MFLLQHLVYDLLVIYSDHNLLSHKAGEVESPSADGARKRSDTLKMLNDESLIGGAAVSRCDVDGVVVVVVVVDLSAQGSFALAFDGRAKGEHTKRQKKQREHPFTILDGLRSV
jgi:hypothetical protein